MIKKILIGIVLLPVFLVLGLVVYIYANSVEGTWRYKITVEIETPEGLKTGYAVREVSNSSMKNRILDLPDVGNPASVSGEAVVVDLGKRGLLFALISDRSDHELYQAFPYNDGRGGETTFEGIRYYNTLTLGMKADLPKKAWPQMVMFKDINDPKSVVLAHGIGAELRGRHYESIELDHIEELFGQGVSLKGITIEMTDNPKTKRMPIYFPYHANMPNVFGYARFTRGGIK